jgi:Photosynthetic reaction centre cytochrome C subunit
MGTTGELSCMVGRMRSTFFVTVLVTLLAAPALAQGTFPPASFKNLQVLPKDASPATVVNAMKGFAMGLGVRCQFCHVGKEGLPLDQFDFVADTIPQKATARAMMRLTADINRQLDAAMPRASGSDPRVTCVTCHRGATTPALAK